MCINVLHFQGRRGGGGRGSVAGCAMVRRGRMGCLESVWMRRVVGVVLMVLIVAIVGGGGGVVMVVAAIVVVTVWAVFRRCVW